MAKRIKNKSGGFENSDSVKIEESAMAVVLCKGKILTITEMIFGRKAISLPKGHTEQGETSLQAAIRECFEETNIVINETDLVKKLEPYTYEFSTPQGELIRKTLIPYLFEVDCFGNPLSKEERMLSVQWMDVDEFLSVCPYENVKNTVNQALDIKG